MIGEDVWVLRARPLALQRHISRIKRRMTDMYDSMSPFVVCNRAPKMGEEELAFLPEAVRFDETGKSLCGWRNPAT